MNSFKISQTDTEKLWMAIQNFSEISLCSEQNKKRVESKRRKMDDAPVERMSSLGREPTLQSNESFVKISKYQIKYSIDLNKK